MTAMQHLYATAHGEYRQGPYLGEHAQIGFRFAFVPVAASPVNGETFTIPENGDAVPEFGTQAGTNGTLTKTWTARLGETGSLENWGAVEQAALGDAFWTLLLALRDSQNINFQWTHVKQAPIDALGKTIGTASTFDFTSAGVGVGTASMPAQSAVAVSTRANIVGRGGRGRYYVPGLSTSLVATDGSVSGGTQTALNVATKAFIDSAQGVIGGLSVMRALYMITSAGKPTGVRPVEVRTGSMVDTIRSRRAQTPEEYVSLDL